MVRSGGRTHRFVLPLKGFNWPEIGLASGYRHLVVANGAGAAWLTYSAPGWDCFRPTDCGDQGAPNIGPEHTWFGRINQPSHQPPRIVWLAYT
jgi:hypothetical protein